MTKNVFRTDEEKRKISIGMKKYFSDPLVRKRYSILAKKRNSGKWMKGRRFNEETKKKISEFHKNHQNKGQFKKGMISWLKGTKGLVKPNKGSFKKGDVRFKNPSRELIRKRLIKRTMSALEIKANKIIKEQNLPYRFVGNGEFFIERKNPDFININGKKIAIEVYYKKHKEEFRGGLNKWMIERSNIFKKYGWKLLFFNEAELNKIPFIKS